MRSAGRGPRIETPSRAAGRLSERHRRAAAGLLLLAAGCAREQAPPGAEIDNTPPRLVSARPEDGSVVPELDDPLVLKFDEPVEENEGLRRRLRASPADRYEVDFGFSTVEIEPEGGWRRNAVYILHIPPPFTDLLGNQTERPIAITFSTGPTITETRVEGNVLDRVEGSTVQGARVLFYRRDGDSVPYTAVQDTADAFALRSLPPGPYRAYGFRDLNGNMRLEARLEAYDSTTFELEGPRDTASMEFQIVEPDSTPPVLGSATAPDSQRVELQFDDYLDPTQDFDRAKVVVRDTATGRTWPVAGVELAPGEEGRRRGGLRRPGRAGRRPPARREPLRDAAPARDTTPPADTAGAAADTAGRAGATPPSPSDTTEAAADTAPLPSRTALVRLDRALERGDVYRVRADSFRNLRHLVGGGDTLFTYPAAEDTAGAPSDTARAERDTARAPADTAGAPPDTAVAPPDTVRAPPDTGRVAPDTADGSVDASDGGAEGPRVGPGEAAAGSSRGLRDRSPRIHRGPARRTVAFAERRP